MRISALLCAAAFAAACAPGSGRVTTSSQAPSTRVKALAIATVRGAGGRGPDVARALAKRLEAGGFRATALEDSDSVLAGSVLDLDVAANPRVLAEIARATGADAVVFLTMDDGWKTLDVAVLNLAGGDPLLRATARPRGAVFATADDAAAGAAEALAPLSPDRARAAVRPGGGLDDLPEP